MRCKCGAMIKTIADMGNRKGQCKKCYAEYQKEYREKHREQNRAYQREYMRTRRWLAGGERWDDMGEALPVNLKSINGTLRMNVRA